MAVEDKIIYDDGLYRIVVTSKNNIVIYKKGLLPGDPETYRVCNSDCRTKKDAVECIKTWLKNQSSHFAEEALRNLILGKLLCLKCGETAHWGHFYPEDSKGYDPSERKCPKCGEQEKVCSLGDALDDDKLGQRK